MRFGYSLALVAVLGLTGCVVEDNEPAPDAPSVEINRDVTPDLNPRTDHDIDINTPDPGRGVDISTPNVDVNVD